MKGIYEFQMKDKENKQVEVRIKSGEKFATEHGFNAIKDGIKQSQAVEADIDRKPPWLRVKLGAGPKYKEVKNLVTKHRLSTVCEESHCPNIGCLLYTSPSPRDRQKSRMPSSA